MDNDQLTPSYVFGRLLYFVFIVFSLRDELVEDFRRECLGKDGVGDVLGSGNVVKLNAFLDVSVWYSSARTCYARRCVLSSCWCSRMGVCTTDSGVRFDFTFSFLFFSVSPSPSSPSKNCETTVSSQLHLPQAESLRMRLSRWPSCKQRTPFEILSGRTPPRVYFSNPPALLAHSMIDSSSLVALFPTLPSSLGRAPYGHAVENRG